jgi:hypothetical protein
LPCNLFIFFLLYSLQEKNKAALDKRKSALGQKSADADKPLPEGWTRVESRSRPGEYVYENKYTEERQAWFPETTAEKPLPAGWRKVGWLMCFVVVGWFKKKSFASGFIYFFFKKNIPLCWVLCGGVVGFVCGVS